MFPFHADSFAGGGTVAGLLFSQVSWAGVGSLLFRVPSQ